MKFNTNKNWSYFTEEEIKEKEPSLFHVFLHNDDFTPKEFVIEILQKFFFMDRNKASTVAMEAHMNGLAICGAFAKDFAEAKVMQVVDYARENEMALLCSAEVAV